MWALLKYLLGRLIELVMIRWIVKYLLIACAWAGYDLATIASRHTLPTVAQMWAGVEAQIFLLDRRLALLKSSTLPEEEIKEKVAELLTDQREFKRVILAMRLATLIWRLKGEYMRRGQ